LTLDKIHNFDAKQVLFNYRTFVFDLQGSNVISWSRAVNSRSGNGHRP
jgi:hypothetical protein